VFVCLSLVRQVLYVSNNAVKDWAEFNKLVSYALYILKQEIILNIY